MLLMAVPRLSAQRLVVGGRAPELAVSEWLTAAPVTEDRTVMVEFFHSANRNSAARIAALDEIARNYAGRLCVVVVTRQDEPQARAMLLDGQPHYSVGYDADGTVSAAFAANYIPYAVIYDRRGRVLWAGNPSSLGVQEIAQYVK